MSSRSATVLVIFIVAVIAFCLASVFASMTGPISFLPNNTQPADFLNNISPIANDTPVSNNDYTYDTQDDDSDKDDSSSSSDDSSMVETTVDKSPSKTPKHTSSGSSGSSSNPSSNPTPSGGDSGESSGDDSSGSDVETTTG